MWYVQYKVLFVEKPGVWLSPDCVHELWLYFGIIIHRNFRVYLWSLITKLISFIGLTKGQVYFIDLNKYIYLTSKVFSAIYFWIWFVQKNWTVSVHNNVTYSRHDWDRVHTLRYVPLDQKVGINASLYTFFWIRIGNNAMCSGSIEVIYHPFVFLIVGKIGV